METRSEDAESPIPSEFLTLLRQSTTQNEETDEYEAAASHGAMGERPTRDQPEITLDHFNDGIDVSETKTENPRAHRTIPDTGLSDSQEWFPTASKRRRSGDSAEESSDDDQATRSEEPEHRAKRLRVVSPTPFEEPSSELRYGLESPETYPSTPPPRSPFEERETVNFDMDTFYRRLLIRFLKSDPLIGEELRNMGINFEKASRADIDYCHNFIITVESLKRAYETELGNCILALKLAKSVASLVDEDISGLEHELVEIEREMKSYDYHLAIIQEVSTMPREMLKTSRPKPFQQLTVLLTKVGMSYAIRKLPDLIKLLMDKYYKATQ